MPPDARAACRAAAARRPDQPAPRGADPGRPGRDAGLRAGALCLLAYFGLRLDRQRQRRRAPTGSTGPSPTGTATTPAEPATVVAPPPPAAPLGIVKAEGFDPQGDGSEKESLTKLAYDAKPIDRLDVRHLPEPDLGRPEEGRRPAARPGQRPDRPLGHAADRRHRRQDPAARGHRQQPHRLDRAGPAQSNAQGSFTLTVAKPASTRYVVIWFTTPGPVQRRIPGRGRRREAAMTATSRPRRPTDADLIAAHVAGDPDAFGELVRRHRDRLWAVALRTPRRPRGGRRRRPGGPALGLPPGRRPSAATPPSPPGCTGSWSTPASTGSGGGGPADHAAGRARPGRSPATRPPAPSCGSTSTGPWPRCPRRSGLALVLVDMQGLAGRRRRPDPRRGRGHGEVPLRPRPGRPGPPAARPADAADRPQGTGADRDVPPHDQARRPRRPARRCRATGAPAPTPPREVTPR